MKETLHIVALRTVRYNDRHSILSAYSLERGPVAFLQPAGTGREANRRRALLMPLGLVECEADIRPGRDIHLMSQPRPMAPLGSLRANPLKGTVAIFLADVVWTLMRESQPDAAAWRFVETSVKALDAVGREGVSNFHICFLMRLGPIIGIEPDVTTYAEGGFFDMAEGIFRRLPPVHRDYLSQQESAMVYKLSRINYLNMHLFKMSRGERGALLEGILRYYSLHYAPLGSLKSLDVLRSLF